MLTEVHPNSALQAMNRSPLGLLGTEVYTRHNFINTISKYHVISKYIYIYIHTHKNNFKKCELKTMKQED